jgi:hypothetical protein
VGNAKAATVAKLLARVTSTSEAEAAASLQGAYKRMVRDGVTMRDLLALPVNDLYQDTLVKLVGVILTEEGLTHSAYREAYAAYMQMIVAKFSGGSSQGSSSSEQSRARDEEARAYESRRREQEAGRGRGAPPPRQAPAPPPETSKEFYRQNSETATTTPWRERRFTFTLASREFSFSPAGFLDSTQIVFGRGSITWHAFHSPGRTLRLMAAGLLYGFGFAGAVIVMAAAAHALTGTTPIYDVLIQRLFSALAAVGFLFKVRQLFLAGWYR